MYVLLNVDMLDFYMYMYLLHNAYVRHDIDMFYTS